jgi:hypothetical protein
MKKILCTLLVLFSILFCSQMLVAQGPPPPPDGHGRTDNQEEGGGAPLNGGLILLIGFSVVYGGIKLHEFFKLEVKQLGRKN